MTPLRSSSSQRPVRRSRPLAAGLALCLLLAGLAPTTVQAQIPQKVIATTTAYAPTDVDSADIDGDGDLDFISASSGDNKIAWHENQIGSGNADSDGFGPQQVISTSAGRAQSVAVADVNNDGRPDILSASAADDKIAWYENQIGSGSADSDGFGSQQVLSTSADEARSVAVADVNDDGRPDILSASAADDKIAWYENQIGSGSADSDGFGTQQVLSTSADGASSVTVADVNDDGRPDVLSASNRDDKIAWYENKIGSGSADGDGFGTQQVISTSADEARSVAVADVNNDGRPDVLSASTLDNKVAWYENKIGSGSADSDGFGPQQVISTSADEARSVAVADINDDGRPDILSASAADDKIAWYENQIGSGSADSDGFGPQQVLSTSADGASSVAVADVNDDGRPDVLSASNRDDKIAWYENKIGSGSADSDGFGPQQVISTSADGARSVAVADVNNDGRLDVLSASRFDNKVAWYENKIGSGSADSDGFGPQQVISASADVAQSVAVADVNNDGRPDVLSASAGDDKIAWYENQIGSGSADGDGFGTQQVLSTSADGAWSVAVADVNNDGRPDVLSASAFDNKVAWYENQIGSGSADSDGFGPQQVLSTSAAGATSVAVADVNDDGRPDVLSASAGDDKIAWYENQIGSGSADSDGFGTQQVISTSADRARSVAATNLDGDADPDILSASGFDDKIAWYENTSGVLPVELAGFEAQLEGETVRLAWQTASETGNAGFRVQRSTSGQGTGEWTTVGQVEGAGTTTQARSYQFTDADLPYEADSLTYRLKQVDTDGSTSYSNSVTVRRSAETLQLLSTYPNPAARRATVRYTVPGDADVTLRLYDIIGRQVRTVADDPSAGRHETTLDVRRLPSGVYFLRLSAEGETRTQKVTVVR